MNLLSLFGQTSNDLYAVDMTNIATDTVVLGIIVFLTGIMLVAYVIIAYLLSRIFSKAGVAGWKAWVPVYSTWVTLKLGGQKGWIALLFLTPAFISLLPIPPEATAAWILLIAIAVCAILVATVFLYIAMYKIGLHFGKDAYFVLWAIFLPIVWYAWLAFDQSTWKEPVIIASFKPSANEKDDSHSSATTV